MANFLPPIDLGQWKPSSAAISSWLYEIWKYLQENPISSEEELTALINERVPEEITEYLAEHPVTAPVTSVNTKTGNVVISYGDLTANMTFPIVYPDDISDLSSQSFLLSAYADGARFAFWIGTNTLYVLDKVGDTVTPVAVGGSGGGGGDGAILSINTIVVPDAAGNAVLTGQSIPVSPNDNTTVNSALVNRPTLNSVIDTIYPIGSIYMSVVSTSPAILFGRGTWTAIEDTFLLAAGSSYEAGSTGGESTHQLVENEIPVLSGTAHFRANNTPNGLNASGVFSSSTSSLTSLPADAAGSPTNELELVFSAGGGSAHNNMPPYLAVYVWKRVL